MSTTPLGLIFDLSDSTEPTFVPWGHATYALFGRNGAGKTRRLEAITHLFHGGTALDSRRFFETGTRSTCSVVVEANLPAQAEDSQHDEQAWASGYFFGFLGDYLQQVHPDDMVALGVHNADAQEMYESHILDHLDRRGGLEPSHMVQHFLRQRYFEISRDQFDRVVIRPCYLESPDHPQVSSHLVDINEESERIGASSIEWSPFATEALSTLEGGKICFASLGIGEFLISRSLDVDAATGHLCVDLRADPEPNTSRIGRHLAWLLSQGVDLHAFAQELSVEATQQLRTALPTLVGLHLEVPSHPDLLRGQEVRWLATVPTGRNVLGRPARLAMDRLSTAERTWARLAIHRATSAKLDIRSTILLLDEPELGLHRKAERDSLSWLADLGQDPNTWLWCATHSPVLLDDDRVTPVAVRDELRSGYSVKRSSTMRLLEPTDRHELEDLGLTPTDLLGTRQGFLLVEGEHDEIVLTEIVGAELNRLRVDIVALRGARKLPGTVEARTLFDFTDALLFALLDAIPPTGLLETWEEARSHADNPDKALAVLSTEFDWPDNTESDWMKEWLMRSIRGGRERHSRVEPLGLSKADIIEYLPVQGLVPAASSWEALREEHRQRREASPTKTPKDFKKWLSDAHNVDITPSAIKLACQSTDHVPTEFSELVERMRSALQTYEAQRAT